MLLILLIPKGMHLPTNLKIYNHGALRKECTNLYN